MNKTVKVVMLPTKQASGLTLAKTSQGNLYLTLNDDGNRQHLYFLDDVKISEGDYYYVSGGIGLSIGIHKMKKDVYNNDWCKKVLASTNPDLELPLIPDSFVQAYANANGNIKEVQIEYDDKHGYYRGKHVVLVFHELIRKKKKLRLYLKHEEKSILVNPDELYYKPKLRKDNTVIVHPSKTYNKEDMKAAFEAGKFSYGKNFPDFDEWFDSYF